MTALNGSIQLRGQTTAEWAADTTPLLDRQPGIDTDTAEFRIGNGTDLWEDLVVPNQLQVILYLFATYVSQPLGIASLNGLGTVPPGELPIDTDPTLSSAANTKVMSSLAGKTYMDGLMTQYAVKDKVKAASTANVNLSSAPSTLDGVTLVNGDRILLKNQSTTHQNGVYVFLTAGGSLFRANDYSTYDDMAVSLINVDQGTVNADTMWFCTSNEGGTLGTTAIAYQQFGSSSTYTADGSSLDLSGGTFSVKADGITASKIAHAVLKAIAGVGTTPVLGHVPRMLDATTAELMPVTDESKALLALTSMSQWQANLGVLLNQVTAKSANYTVTTNDRGQLFAVTTSTSTITLTLPSASGLNGFAIGIRKADAALGTVITSPATGTLVHSGDHMVLISDGTNWQVAHEPSPTMCILYYGATGNVAWTNQLLALAFLFDLPRAVRVDLTGRRLIRLTGLVHTIGHTTAKLILRYRTSYSTTTTDYSDFTTEVSIAISATGGVSSGWVTIPTGAQGDVYLTVLGSGGNGAADPIFSSLNIEVH